MKSSLAAGFRAAWKTCRDSVQRTIPFHIPIYACALLFCGLTLAIASVYGVPVRLGAGSFFFGMVGQFAALMFGLLAAFEYVRLARAGYPKNPLSLIGRRVFAWLMSGDRPGNIIHTFIVFPVLMITFCALKDQIPQINPFSWDKTFMLMDKVIGFGHTPWEILQPVLGFPAVTAVVNIIYNFWFAAMLGVLFWQAFAAKSSVTRLQFLLAFSFAWFIAGNLLAVVFSSAGPCFYGRLHLGPDPYAGQMAYLNYVRAHWPSWAYVTQDVTIQNLLWKMYLTHSGSLGGISAMPSIHVTSSAVMMLLGWKIDRRLGWVLTIFTGLIFVGSVRLGWHYAADGIAGLLLAAVFWMAAGRIATAWYRLLSRRQADRSIAAAIPTEA